MVHKLVTLHTQSFNSQSLCNTYCIFMGFGGAKLKGRPGKPTL